MTSHNSLEKYDGNNYVFYVLSTCVSVSIFIIMDNVGVGGGDIVHQ